MKCEKCNKKMKRAADHGEMIAPAAWISANKTKYRVLGQWAPCGCIHWRAERLDGERICSGVTDKPTTAAEREMFAAEIKAAVNYSLEPYGSP